MYYSIPQLSALFAAAVIPNLRQHNPVVHLDYASYKGHTSQDGVTQWLGIQYAAPPLGNLRFAAPEDPPHVAGVQDTNKHKPYCLALGARPPLARETSEDCLYLDVYAPSNSTEQSELPVFFFIQGGGFASDANANIDGHGLVQASGHQIVVVTFNYRVGPYGFISGKDIKSANNGLKDQRKALQWVQRHIAGFGGNPNHVVLGGDSAGAASIVYQLMAYGGRDDRLFHGAAAESQSFPTTLRVNESQYLYNDLVRRTGCSSHRSGTLACLRGLTADQIQKNAITVPYPGHKNPPIYSWVPVIDGDLIRDYAYRAFNNGAFVRVPTIFGDDTNGGTVFAPRSADSLNDSNKFLRDQFPYLTDSQVKALNELYPNPNLRFPNSGSYWRQAANVYGDMRYMCPGLFMSSVYSSYNVPSWNYRYNVQDPDKMKSGLGVPHVAELGAIWSDKGGGIVPVIQAFWTSFIKTLDPNTYRLKGTKKWEQWNAREMNRFLFDSPVKNSRMEIVDNAWRARCEYIWSIGVAIRQ